MKKAQPSPIPKPLSAMFINNWALALKASILAAAPLVLYWQDLGIVFTDAWQSEATSYMLAIPFLLA